MFFSGDFNFMQAIAAAGGSPLQGALMQSFPLELRANMCVIIGAAPDQSKFGYGEQHALHHTVAVADHPSHS